MSTSERYAPRSPITAALVRPGEVLTRILEHVELEPRERALIAEAYRAVRDAELQAGYIEQRLRGVEHDLDTVSSAAGVTSVNGLTGAVTIDGGVTTGTAITVHAEDHRARHISGGADAFLSSDLLEAVVKRLRESSGPTDLTLGAVADGQVLVRSGATIIGSAAAVTDHGVLTGLGDDDHLQYLLLAGRAGGQTANGGTAAGEKLTLVSTAHATKGRIRFGASDDNSFDESTGELGIGTSTPYGRIHGYRAVSDASGSGTDFAGVVGGVRVTTTVDGAHSWFGTWGQAESLITAGKTNSGALDALLASAFRDNGSDGGTLSNLRGLRLSIGHETTVAGTAVTTVAVGALIQLMSGAGTVADLFGVQIKPISTGGTLTNVCGIEVEVPVAGTSTLAIRTKNGAVVLNEDGGDFDTRIEGDTDANLLFADASADAIGIGTNAPAAFLHHKASTTGKASDRIPAGTAPTSPGEGDLWNDSTQKALVVFEDGVKQHLLGVLFTQTASATHGNSATEATVLGSGVGTLTLPANFFVAGKTIRVVAWGYYSATGTGGHTIRFKVKLGSTVVLDTGAIQTQATTNRMWRAEGLITCRTTGAGGTVFGQGHVMVNTTGSATGATLGMTNTATTALDTTASQVVDVTVTWSNASATNTATGTNCLLEAAA